MAVDATPIAVLGPGSWGSALACVLARNGKPVRLWGNVADQIRTIQDTRQNPDFLPGVILPESIVAFESLSEAVQGVSDILLVVPSHAFRPVLKAIADINIESPRILWATKGLEPDTGRFLHEVVEEFFPGVPRAVLSGPSFAKEVADEIPTWVNLACRDDAFAKDCQAWFENRVFHVQRATDEIGVSLCGVAKNVMAIGVGLVDGLGLGANTRAAFLTRGFSELATLVVAVGGDRDTVMSLAGLGDTVLTCTDNQSRNRRFGIALGEGKTVEQAFEVVGQEVEGFHNVKQVYELAQKANVTLPIVAALHGILCEGAEVRTILF